MALEFKDKKVILTDVVGVEDAEALLEWLQKRPYARAVFSHCTYVHPSTIQVLLAAGVPVSAWPEDAELSNWLKSVLSGCD
jgi:hypothetical protein